MNWKREYLKNAMQQDVKWLTQCADSPSGQMRPIHVALLRIAIRIKNGFKRIPRVKAPIAENFYSALDRRVDLSIGNHLMERPDDIHDYQGCVADRYRLARAGKLVSYYREGLNDLDGCK